MIDHPSLLGRFIQLGYVTRDLDAAKRRFGKRFGPCDYFVLESDGSAPENLGVLLTFFGTTMVEIIHVNPDVDSIYLDKLPQGEGDVAFHHLGFLVDDIGSTMNRLKSDGYAVPVQMSYGDVLELCYADMRQTLGHYCEYIRLGEKGREMVKSIPGFTRFPD